MIKVKGEHNHPIVIKRKSAPRTRRARPDEQNLPVRIFHKQIRNQQQPVFVSVVQQHQEYYDDDIEYIINEDISL